MLIGNDLVAGQIASNVNDEIITTFDSGTFSIIVSKSEDCLNTTTQACGYIGVAKEVWQIKIGIV